jgi:predicted tellurium resistance membrane protein TerC
MRLATQHGYQVAVVDHGQGLSIGEAAAARAKSKTFSRALTQIVVADVSMSLDNVLAVAGTARHHLEVLVIGLALSVGLMGLAATMIARVLHRHPWISYLGLILIAWVAVAMITEGSLQVLHATGGILHL